LKPAAWQHRSVASLFGYQCEYPRLRREQQNLLRY
jgi:hypothetical protein